MAGWLQLATAAYSLYDSQQQGKRLGKLQSELMKGQTVPTIDDARQRQMDQDRMRRRRGMLANIYAGESDAPAVATKRLTGLLANQGPSEILG